MCRECGHCKVADTVGLCGYWGFNVLLEDKCHHYTPRPDAARCRVCGDTWDSTDGCYWVEEDLCAQCATQELNGALSGWHAISREISKDKRQAACGRAKARAAGNYAFPAARVFFFDAKGAVIVIAPHVKEQFAAKLIQAMAEYGITQTQLAQRMGVTRQAVSGWTLGRYMPEDAHLIELADILGVSPEWLAGEKP